MYRNQYCGQEKPADASPGKKKEPGGGSGGGRVLCAGRAGRGT